MKFRECRSWNDRMAKILERLVVRTPISPSFVGNYAALMNVTRPDLAIRLIRVKLDFDLAQAQVAIGPVVPVEDDESFEAQMDRYSRESERRKPLKQFLDAPDDWYPLDEIATRSPSELIEGLWSWVENLSRAISKAKGRTEPGEDYEWHFGEKYIRSHLSTSLWNAAAGFAKSDPTRFLSWVTLAKTSEIWAVHRLIRHGLAQITTEHPRAVFEYLTSPGELALGDSGEGEESTTGLLGAVKDGVSAEETDALIASIGSWLPIEASPADEQSERSN
jgi:hypothetical protein